MADVDGVLVNSGEVLIGPFTPESYKGVILYGAGPAGTKIFKNRVYDTIVGGFVNWDNTYVADDTGLNYPGPGTFGVHTSDYCVVRIITIV